MSRFSIASHAKANLIIAAAAGATVIGLAAPASADTTGGTTATITITGGSLAISVTATADLTGTAHSEGEVISGLLGAVTVSDARTGVVGWNATAISTAFTSGGNTIAASAVAYAAGNITGSGGTFNAQDRSDLSGPTPPSVVTATSVIGDNSASWDPTIKVTVPQGTLAGVYVATITHSVS